jgi:hypothetical protein
MNAPIKIMTALAFLLFGVLAIWLCPPLFQKEKLKSQAVDNQKAMFQKVPDSLDFEAPAPPFLQEGLPTSHNRSSSGKTQIG